MKWTSKIIINKTFDFVKPKLIGPNYKFDLPISHEFTIMADFAENEVWTCNFEVMSPCLGFESVTGTGLTEWRVNFDGTSTYNTGPSFGADLGRYVYHLSINFLKISLNV